MDQPGPIIGNLTRREALTRSMGGLGGVVLSWMMQQNALKGADGVPVYDLLPRTPHFKAKAKAVIFLFMPGGPSQMDLLDPKPLLTKLDGQDSPIKVVSRSFDAKPKIWGSPFKFQKYGQSGTEVSELLPGLASVIDEVAVIRSGVTERVDHDTATYHFLTGRNTAGFPTFGAWSVYGLGTENQDLPAYVALQEGGLRKFYSGFLPSTYQGTLMEPEGIPLPDLQRPKSWGIEDERSVIDMVNGLNQIGRSQHPELSELDTRIANYELAARMQIEAMKRVDFSKESEATKRMYGLDQDDQRSTGLRCLLARRLVESGVRFVQLQLSAWDHHSNLPNGLKSACRQTDGPIGGLIKDLKQRGLLDSTLVVWGGEFGRLPTVQVKDGRDHNPHGFTVWMAGGGIKGGQVYGSTDEFGYAAVDNPVSHSDMHATILHLLGMDVRKLTYDYDGRVETLIGVNPARVLKDIVS